MVISNSHKVISQKHDVTVKSCQNKQIKKQTSVLWFGLFLDLLQQKVIKFFFLFITFSGPRLCSLRLKAEQRLMQTGRREYTYKLLLSGFRDEELF